MTGKIFAASGIEGLDLKLESILPSHGMELVGTCYHRSVLEKVIKETGADTVLMSPKLAGLIDEKDFIDLIYSFRVTGLRVVILPGNPHLDSTKKLVMELVPLGVYDFIYDEVKVDEVVERLLNPMDLGDLPSGIVKTAIENEKVSAELEKSLPTEKIKVKEGSLKGKLRDISKGFFANKKRDFINSEVDVNEDLEQINYGNEISLNLPEGFYIFGKTQGPKSYTSIKELCTASPQAVLIFSSGPSLLETIKTLRREIALSYVPIVVVGKTNELECYSAGADECVQELNGGAINRIQARSAKMREMWDKAVRDDLTGLYRKQFLESYLSEQVRRFCETGVPFSVMMADLDYFKRVNDTQGHQAGNMVLKKFAAFLQAGVRQTDIVARYGGEEFLVVFPGVEDAWAIANKLCGDWAGKEIILSGSKKIRSTFSAGLAVIGKDAADVDGIIETADRALYQAKKSGRNRVVAAAAVAENNSRVVVVFGTEGAFVAANLAASLTWQGRTACLIDLSPEHSAADIFSTEPQGLEQVRGDPVGAWKKGGRPKELPGLLITAAPPDNLEDLAETLPSDFIIVHAGKSQLELSGNEGTVIKTYREGGNVILKVVSSGSEVYIISIGHLSNVFDKACRRRVPVMLLSPEMADAFANLSANIFFSEGG